MVTFPTTHSVEAPYNPNTVSKYEQTPLSTWLIPLAESAISTLLVCFTDIASNLFTVYNIIGGQENKVGHCGMPPDVQVECGLPSTPTSQAVIV